MNKEDTTDYYDYTRRFYKYFWHGDTGAVHYGFWNEGINSHKEALINTNRVLAEVAQINKEDIVLDAGCGVGGSAVWLAENIGCKVRGITISPKQLREAKKTSAKRKLDYLIDFSVADFNKTSFGNEVFTVVWGIESICHAKDKENFLTEAYRLLRPGGRIVMSDGFIKNLPLGNKQKKQLNVFLEGWAVDNLSCIDDFRNSLEKVGFKNIKIVNRLEETKKESQRIYYMSIWGYPLSLLTTFLGFTKDILVKNNKAGIYQKYLIDSGVFNHYTVVAFK